MRQLLPLRARVGALERSTRSPVKRIRSVPESSTWMVKFRWRQLSSGSRVCPTLQAPGGVGSGVGVGAASSPLRVRVKLPARAGPWVVASMV